MNKDQDLNIRMENNKKYIKEKRKSCLESL